MYFSIGRLETGVNPALAPVFLHLGLTLMLGLWIPPYLSEWYRQAAQFIG